MEYKLDYMYNHLDYDHDRAKVREKYLNEINRRTTLEDIGETLDQLVLDSKAKNYKYYNLAQDHDAQPESKSKSFGHDDFQWSSRILKQHDVKTPKWFDDPAEINKMNEAERDEHQEIIDEVRYNDSQRDYSEQSLT